MKIAAEVVPGSVGRSTPSGSSAYSGKAAQSASIADSVDASRSGTSRLAASLRTFRASSPSDDGGRIIKPKRNRFRTRIGTRSNLSPSALQAGSAGRAAASLNPTTTAHTQRPVAPSRRHQTKQPSHLAPHCELK